MPVLQVDSSISRIGKSTKFLDNSSTNPNKFLDEKEVSLADKCINNGCKRAITSKPIKVTNIGNFCSVYCWNEFARNRVNEEYINRLESIPIRSERMIEIESRFHNPTHISIYICRCLYALDFRAGELGLTRKEFDNLKDIV